MLDVPTYGHSNNHAGLQLADLLVSAVLSPVSTQTFCSNSLAGTSHLSPEFIKLRERYGARLKKLQFRYQNSDGSWAGGLSLSNPGGRSTVADIFG
jgi:hypothetical protein